MTVRHHSRRIATALLLCLGALGAAGGCKSHKPTPVRHRGLALPPVDRTWSPTTLASVRGVAADTIRAAIAARLKQTRPAPLGAYPWKHVGEIYAEYGSSPLWMDADGLRGDRTGALLRAVASADSDALQLTSYPLRALGGALDAVRATKAPTAAQIAEADVLLTAVYVALGSDMLTGQVDPRAISQDWHIDPREEDVDSALVNVIRTQDLGAALGQLRPQEEDYEALRKQLQRYRGLVAAGGWKPVPKGKSLKPGDFDGGERLNALYDRLRVEGYLAADAGRPVAPAVVDTTKPAPPAGALVYDEGLAGAVARFQETHAINVDSVLGPETVDALNKPAEYRLGQIAANLERYRWLPRTLGSRYILVNVPAFRFEAYDDDTLALEMKVIVGAEYKDKNTPTFSDMMETVVFRPYWNITPDIQEKEIGPKIAADPEYMERNDLEYWNENGATRIRQKPGPKNSLGLVKFLFPNDFNIYLHDTPERGLFEKDVRAFSHGCIRLEKPAELAQWVLGWDADSVERAMEEEPNNKAVRLKRKIPVFIVYFTAFTTDGQLYFGNDLYERDEKLVAAVGGGAAPSEAALQAAQALRGIAAQLKS